MLCPMLASQVGYFSCLCAQHLPHYNSTDSAEVSDFSRAPGTKFQQDCVAQANQFDNAIPNRQFEGSLVLCIAKAGSYRHRQRLDL